MKAVIFDLFETLVTEWGHEKYTKRKMAEDLSVDAETFSNEWEALHSEMYLGKLDFNHAVRFVLKRMNATIDDETLHKVLNKRVSTKAACFDNIASGITGMLSNIRNKELKLGLISNCSSDEIIGFQSSGLASYFDTVLFSCDIGMRKPDKEIFERCALELKVLPSECLYIGDGGSHELEGSSYVGMKTLQATWFIKEFGYNYENTKGYETIDIPQKLSIYL